jgi:predicted DNA-binding transcriptional regulator YafY
VRASHASCTIGEGGIPDGLRVTLPVRQSDESMRWLLGWGRNTQLLEPKSVREQLQGEAEALPAHEQELVELLP